MYKFIFVFGLYLSSAALADSRFTEASDAFTNGDISRAIELFSHLAKTDDSAEVIYNLAICHFKLKHWIEARELFSQLQEANPSEDLINYNLAITEKKLGNFQAAKIHFETMIQHSENDSMIALAHRQLIRMARSNPERDSDKQGSWILGTKIETGNYDNLLTPSQEQNTGTSDNLIESQAYFRWQTNGNRMNKWLVDGILYSSKYEKTTRYDANFAKLGVRKYTEIIDGYWFAGVNFDTSQLDDEGYLQNISAEVGLIQRFRKLGHWGVNYRFREVDSLNTFYDPNSGHSEQLKLTIGSHIDSHHSWELNYRFEQDRRQDAESLASYRSFSPDRHSLLGTWLYEQQQWRLNMTLEYRDSEYQDHNLYLSGLRVNRDDQRYKASLQAKWKFSKEWNINASLSYMNNQSNIEIYDYQQRLVKLGIAWEFR